MVARWITYIVALTTPEAILVDGTATSRNFVAVWRARKLSVATCSSCTTTTRFELKIFRYYFKGLTWTSCESKYSWLSSLRSWHENSYNFLHISDHVLQNFSCTLNKNPQRLKIYSGLHNKFQGLLQITMEYKQLHYCSSLLRNHRRKMDLWRGMNGSTRIPLEPSPWGSPYQVACPEIQPLLYPLAASKLLENTPGSPARVIRTRTPAMQILSATMILSYFIWHTQFSSSLWSHTVCSWKNSTTRSSTLWLLRESLVESLTPPECNCPAALMSPLQESDGVATLKWIWEIVRSSGDNVWKEGSCEVFIYEIKGPCLRCRGDVPRHWSKRTSCAATQEGAKQDQLEF